MYALLRLLTVAIESQALVLNAVVAISLGGGRVHGVNLTLHILRMLW